MTMIESEPPAPAALPAVYLIRHGQTDWSLSGRHTGRTNLPLTPAGEQEACALARRWRPVVFGRVFCSPRLRDRQTCELAGLGNAREIEPELVEWDYGDYEGYAHRRDTAAAAGLEHLPRRLPPWRIARPNLRPRLLADRPAADAGGQHRALHPRPFQPHPPGPWAGLTVPAAAHLISSTASVGILTYEHDLSQPGIALWNAT